jgi:hypothetical protein
MLPCWAVTAMAMELLHVLDCANTAEEGAALVQVSLAVLVVQFGITPQRSS